MASLSNKDQMIVERAFQFGRAAFREAGMSDEEAVEFLSRDDVQEALDSLNKEYEKQEILQATTRFMTRRKLSRLAGDAVWVLEKALSGPVFLRDKEGAIQVDFLGRPRVVRPLPEREEMLAAKEVLDRLGVVHTVRDTSQNNSSGIKAMLKSGNVQLLGSGTQDVGIRQISEGEKALSRERVRNVIEILKADLQVVKVVESGKTPDGTKFRKWKSKKGEKE